MKHLIPVLMSLLFVCGHVSAQEISPMGEKPTSEAVKSAKDILAQSENKVITLPLHGYAIIPLMTAGESFLVPDSDECVGQLLIPKGGTYEGFLVSKDRPGVHVYTKIAPDAKYDRVLVPGLTPGKATIVWHAVKDGKSVIVDAKKFIVLSDDPPKPPGPNPPGPQPPTPIPGDGFKVLFVVESKTKSELPPTQLQALTAKDTLDYLDSHCAKVDGQPEYRTFDPDTDMSKASKFWQDGMARPRSSLPWVLITNGKTGYEGPLPLNKDALLKLLKEYGGQ